MAYKRKTPLPNQKPKILPAASPKSSDSGEPSEPEVVETNVEAHDLPDVTSSLIDRAKNKLVEMGQDSIDGGSVVTEDKPKSNWRKYSNKAKQDRSKAEFATLVSTVIILLVALWPAPDTVKPNELEVNALSEHLSNIVLRHFDLSGAITADVLDVIGIIAVTGTWLSRVGPELRALNKKEVTATRLSSGSVKGTPEKELDRSETPIEKLSPETKAYLDRLAAENESTSPNAY